MGEWKHSSEILFKRDVLSLNFKTFMITIQTKYETIYSTSLEKLYKLILVASPAAFVLHSYVLVSFFLDLWISETFLSFLQ